MVCKQPSAGLILLHNILWQFSRQWHSWKYSVSPKHAFRKTLASLICQPGLLQELRSMFTMPQFGPATQPNRSMFGSRTHKVAQNIRIFSLWQLLAGNIGPGTEKIWKISQQTFASSYIIRNVNMKRNRLARLEKEMFQPMIEHLSTFGEQLLENMFDEQSPLP